MILDRDGLHVQAAVAGGGESGDEVCAEVESRLREALGERGVDLPALTVVPVSEIPATR